MGKRGTGLFALARTVWGRALIFLFITLSLLVVAGTAVFNWSQDALLTQIVALSAAQANAGMERIEAEIQKLSDTETKLLFDTDVNRLGVMPGYYTRAQSAPAMLRAANRMQLLADSSHLAAEALFLAPSIGKAISGGGVETLDDSFYRAISGLCIEETKRLIELDGQYYICKPYPVYASYLKAHGAMYVLAVRLDARALEDALSDLRAREDECALLFQGGRVVAASGAPCADPDSLLQAARDGDAFFVTGGDGSAYVGISKGDAQGDLCLIKLLPRSRAYSSLDKQRRLFAVLLALAVAANLLCAWRLWRSIHKPLRALSGALKRVEDGDMSARIHHARGDEFAYIYERFNLTTEKLESLIEQIYKQTIRTQRAELKQLQSQINPHFLYNSFFMLKSLARMGNCESIEQTVNELGEYFQYITRSGEESTTLEREIAHARNYAAIQDMRFSSRIHLDFPPAPEAFARVRAPRLIMQPLLENAYSHGLSGTSGKGELRIRYGEGGKRVWISVEDSGGRLTDEAIDDLRKKLSDPDAPETTGMVNIHRRLCLQFGEGYGLTLSKSELGGLRVVMTLPGEGGSACGA